ncbi:MAG: M1 family aminopeptidase [Chrysiogenia bacterium]
MGKTYCQHSLGRRFSRICISFSFGFVLIAVCASADYAADKNQAVRTDSRRNSLTWVGYYDPDSNYLSAKALLRFESPLNERNIWLDKGLRLNSVQSGSAAVVDLNRDSGQFLLKGQNGEELEITYNGRLASAGNPESLSSEAIVTNSEIQLDRFRFLSCVKDFYPHTGMDFGSIILNISVPREWNCLGSGILRSVRLQPGLSTYVFDNDGAKGMSLVFGRFSQIDLIDALIPVRLHGWPLFNYNWYYPKEDIVRILTFYQERFGALDVPELNILFRRGRNFGGVSYSGLIVLDVDASWTSFSLHTRKNIRSDSPLSFIDAKVDVLSHEIAHQWWGGLISWKTPVENWITEGLATYSSLISLRAWKGEKAYRRALAGLRRQLHGYAHLGAPAEGYKLFLRDRDPKVYQALVYGKPTLMLVALADKIGEMELCRRLRCMLSECRKKSMDAQEFLCFLSGGDVKLLILLKQWIYDCGLPKEL